MSRHYTFAAATVAAALATIGSAALPASAAPVATNAVAAPVFGVAQFATADFGYDQGWRVDKHPRFTADITGDGRADVVGFFNDGVRTAVANGAGGFGATRLGVPDFGYDEGWRIGTHPRFVTDITGDGRADILGIGNAGVWTAVSRGDGTFDPARLVLSAFGSTTRPAVNQLFAADVNADGRTDLVSIGTHRVDVALAQAGGTFAAPILASTEFDFFNFANFRVADVTGDGRAEILAIQAVGPIHIVSASPRTDGTYTLSRRAISDTTSSSQLMDAVADVTGDGRADILAFGQVEATSYVAVSNGDGTFADFKPAANDFGAGAGWTGTRHVRDVGDVTGDGRGDIVGFGNGGVFAAAAQGDGTFGGTQQAVADLGYDQGWRVEKNPRLVADITGDGRADLVGFGNAGVITAVAQAPNTPPAVVTVPDLTDDSVDQAVADLQAAGLSFGTLRGVIDNQCNHIGTVASQNPRAGTQVQRGSAVDVTVGELPSHPCP
jgi:hypothetical protein